MEKDNERALEILGRSVRFGTKLCCYDRDFTVLDVDDNYAELIGISPVEKNSLIGKTVRDCIYPQDVSHVARQVHGFEKTSREYECKYRLMTQEGNYIWVKDVGEVVIIEGKKCIRSVVIDIDEKEKLIKQRDVTYESVPGGVGFFVIGKDNFYIREANTHYFDMMGVNREDYLGSSGKYTFPEDLPKLREHLVTQAAKHEPVDYEFRTRKESGGEVHWYRVLGNHYDTREEGEEYLCILIDITRRKITEFELIEEKEKYRMAMKSTVDLLYEYDVKKEKFRLFGYNYMTEDTSLFIDKSLDSDYKQLLFSTELVYKGDRRKIVSFIRNDNSCFDNIRMLTQNKQTGKTYYDNYEVYMNKVYEEGQISRVVGYVKKISYKTVPVTVKQELHQIFDEYILKEYCFLLKIDVPTESFTPYFFEDCGWEDYRGNRYYDSFLYWWCKNMIAPEDQKEILFFMSLEQMLRVLHSGEPKGYRFCRVRGNDKKYKYKICTFSFYSSDVNTIIFTVRDVNAIRAEEEYQEMANQKILTDALNEAKQAVESRKAVMNFIVKELNDPIVTMKELTNAPYSAENAKNVSKCVDYLGEMIDSIEEYNYLESFHDHSAGRVQLYKLCNEVCGEERKISLGLDISINEYITLPQDAFYLIHEFRFKEILVNLLGNAIKYAPNGSQINLYIKETGQEKDKRNICIIMEDEGPVISEELFERKMSGGYENHIRDKIVALGGAGYSISLASKIASLLGGTVQFRKGVVHNSVVQIDIPVYVTEANDEVIQELPEQHAEISYEVDLRGQGILLVENEGNDSNKLIAPLLRVNGAKVYVAATGEEAINLLNEFETGTITAILVDRELSDMNCYEFAKKIKYTRKNIIRRIPVIEMLEGIQTDDTRISLISGINAIIYKPINLSKLLMIIESLQEMRGVK